MSQQIAINRSGIFDSFFDNTKKREQKKRNHNYKKLQNKETTIEMKENEEKPTRKRKRLVGIKIGQSTNIEMIFFSSN